MKPVPVTMHVHTHVYSCTHFCNLSSDFGASTCSFSCLITIFILSLGFLLSYNLIRPSHPSLLQHKTLFFILYFLLIRLLLQGSVSFSLALGLSKSVFPVLQTCQKKTSFLFNSLNTLPLLYSQVSLFPYLILKLF